MIVLCRRSPEDAKTKQKMLYTSCYDHLPKVLTGLKFNIKADDLSDLEYESGESIGLHHFRHHSNNAVITVLKKYHCHGSD